MFWVLGHKNKNTGIVVGEIEPIIMPQTEFGIVVDSLKVIKDTIKDGETLSDILQQYKVPYAKIYHLDMAYKDVFNLTKIRSGNAYTLIMDKDTSERLLYYIYEISKSKYVLMNFTDSVSTMSFGEKEIVAKTETISGVILKSLWISIQNQNKNPQLSLDLSDIFAWTIDFYALQKGDKYKVYYEHLYVEDESIGIGKILGAWFNHSNQDYYAIYYTQDSLGDYFDEYGNSLRREFLKAPLNFSRISSRFSHSRLHPILRIRRPHHGVDYAAPIGTPVVAIGDGTIVKKGWSGGAGRMVKIRHNSAYTTAYLHLSKYGEGISTGVRVKQGQIIGYVGSSGLSTGPHLDFRFYKNGVPVDPLKVESPPVDPIDSANMKDYLPVRDSIMNILDNIPA